MTQAKPRFSSFAEYLAYSDGLEGRYTLVNGEPIELPPESPENDFIARLLLLNLATSGIAPLALVTIHTLQIQVSVLEPGDPASRYPDLAVLRPEHLELMQRRLTVTIDMPPPRLVAEVISSGNRNRDFERKRSQYADRGIPEYWLIDPEDKTVTVLLLEGDEYEVFAVYRGNTPIISPALGTLAIAPVQLFGAE
ncbi:Uma2 family endonuclease [Thermoleptolyngbya sp. C42_A2020_037]|uniref:Uma2 family endonuclease n=1 Tax=Thermoleptolyngbya sp. C42_A2020_037 TaxID=2747799 RepID=UPI001A0E7BB5|nr:Uma2 family endonuclease [Thermoleptolyngbya sp. C42_A2020_037]MBF2083418.1 Uma2 family endonuclease [Thermoleptolyngbya sp. C42_A2020_037]